MKCWRHPLVKLAISVAVVLTLHAALLGWLAEKNVVAAVLSAGAHSRPVDLWAAGAFIVVRLLAVLLLPATVLMKLVWWWFQRREGKHAS